MKLKKIIKDIYVGNVLFSISLSKNQMLLMNKNGLLLAGSSNLIIIDIQKKEIIKFINYKITGYISFMYRLTYNNILFCGWKNRIEQIEYDEIKKTIKNISNNNINDYKPFPYDLNFYKISSFSVFNNNLIVIPFDNKLGDYSSLIIYQYKK